MQVVLLGDLAEADELIGSDLAAGHTRHHRIGPVALHVGHEAIVGVLQRCMLLFEDVLIPGAGQNTADGRLADLAAFAGAMGAEQGFEGLQLAEAHGMNRWWPRRAGFRPHAGWLGAIARWHHQVFGIRRHRNLVHHELVQRAVR